MTLIFWLVSGLDHDPECKLPEMAGRTRTRMPFLDLDPAHLNNIPISFRPVFGLLGHIKSAENHTKRCAPRPSTTPISGQTPPLTRVSMQLR